jgi:hypothetical protein
VYTSPPPPPGVVEAGTPSCPQGTTGVVPGCTVTFTVTSTDTTADPAVKFVWAMDQNPPASAPAGQVITLNGAKSATVKVTIPDPGPHALFAYTIDSGSSHSQPASGKMAEVTSGDTVLQYASFSDALKDKADNNQMISSGSGSSGTANADGGGKSIDEKVLQAAGWVKNGTVTIDGATFRLPAIGSATTYTPDNILARGQQIGMPAGSQGTSLVFLATSTNATMQQPLATKLPTGDTTVPFLPGGSPVTGLECDTYQSGQPNPKPGNPSPYCQIPLGQITYSGAPAQNYWLTVPDWITGPPGAAALNLDDTAPSEDSATGTTSNIPQIYAFSVPLNPGAQVTSVSLPDIGAAVSAQSSAGGLVNGVPALHILGMAIANTTISTPGTPNGSFANTPGQTWTAGWASPTEGANSAPSILEPTWSAQTLRTKLTVAVGGSSLRLRLSDDLGWYAMDAAPLQIGAVTVAQAGTGAAVTGQIYSANFTSVSSTNQVSTSGSVVIPVGGDAYSDPVNIPVTPGEQLAVSIYLKGSYPYLVQHTYCSACTTYLTAQGTNDHTGDGGGSAFTSSGQYSDILTSLDVQTSGIPTVAVLGNNVIDGWGDGNITTIAPTAPRISDLLAAQQISASGGPKFSVIDEGIEANGMLYENLDTASGPSSLSRLAADVLSEPGVGTVIVDQGLEDLLTAVAAGTSVQTVADDLTWYRYPQLISQLQAWGIEPILTSLTPCSGYNGANWMPQVEQCTTSAATIDAQRVGNVNNWMQVTYSSFQTCPTLPSNLSSYLPAYWDDIDTPVVQPNSSPEAISNGSGGSPNYDTGDHVNFNAAGYSALAGAINSCQFRAVIPPQY